MGAKLAAYFEKAKRQGGLEAQVKLAMLTKLSQKAAAEAPDSPENIKRFEEAMVRLEQ
jgi:hypothetical protein